MQDLAEELKRSIEGEVRFDDGSRALYATDASNYRQVPIGVVIPRTVEDMIQTVAVARKFGAPVLARGGGTSLAGQCCNVAVVLDTSKYLRRVLQVDPVNRIAEVEPGAVLDDLRDAAEQHHLTFGPDPATHNRCTLGGMIGNNSCGVHSVYSGKTDDNTEELDVITYSGLRLRVGKTSGEDLQRIIAAGGPRGEIYSRIKSLTERYADLIRRRYPKIPRRVSGYNLDQLLPENGFHVARALVGTEGTCAIVLSAKLRLVQSPPFRVLLVIGYPDMPTAADHLMEVLAHHPLAVEGMDQKLMESMRKKNLHTQNMKLLPEGEGWLLVEMGGETEAEALAKTRALMEAMMRSPAHPHTRLFEKASEARLVWRIRESSLGGTAYVPGEPMNWEGWEDAAVPPEKVGSYLRDFQKLMDHYSYTGCLYGHFGDGCVHTRTNFDLQSAEGIRKYRAFVEEAADLVVSYGGSLSGEHGDGQSRAELLPKMFGPELVEAFREFKTIWDPANKMNPGKVVNAYRLDENLRLGADYHPPALKTHFQFPIDQGSFANTTLRCVGVGECRRTNTGVMCPSYMATHEEKHSTRGRARLLFEMLHGDVVRKGWKDDAVKEALDLCLACKGCKSDCPVGVDMATYKAEFLAHYYEGKKRPRTAFSMGWISRWSRVASISPSLANAMAQAAFSKAIAGVAPQRRVPAFAKRNFRDWFSKHPKTGSGKDKVLLWPDTFNNYFRPATAIAAVHVLEKSGFMAQLPEQILCCGRPLYDYGMLDTAKDFLRKILHSLREEIAAGIPIVGLEPSCIAVFRDELVNLFPEKNDAVRLAQQTYLLSEFLEKRGVKLPRLERKAIVQAHCHHHAVMGLQDEKSVLSRIGLDFELLDSGCCGMAGSFGFEKEHHDLSIAIAERVLLPAVRNASPETLIIADGFSCREQIEQCTNRRTYHLAEVLSGGELE